MDTSTGTAIDSPITAEHILKTGLLNLWYLVCHASEVGATPKSLTRLGRDIALWRDAAGKVHAVEDFCPHRGAKLSMGRVVESGLACAYHGLSVDGEGVVRGVPPVQDCPLLGKKAIIGYPVRETLGAIFLYFSDGIGGSVPDLELPAELVSEDWSGFLHAEEWNCHYSLPLDNRLDPMHAPFLHAQSFTLAYGVKQSQITLTQTEKGFVIERDNQRGTNIDRTEVTWMPGSNFWIATEIPYPKRVGGNFFRIISHVTPIDEHRTYFWIFRWQKSGGWRRDMWRFLYKNRLDRRHIDVLQQDRLIMEGIPKGNAARDREMLIQCDVGVARIRRLMRQEAQAQALRLNEHRKARKAAA